MPNKLLMIISQHSPKIEIDILFHICILSSVERGASVVVAQGADQIGGAKID